jgi:hypothetical protein
MNFNVSISDAGLGNIDALSIEFDPPLPYSLHFGNWKYAKSIFRIHEFSMVCGAVNHHSMTSPYLHSYLQWKELPLYRLLAWEAEHCKKNR